TGAALVAATVTARGVELAWHGIDLAGAGAIVERRGERGAWTELGAPSVVGADWVLFTDTRVSPGRWAYRLRVPEGASWATTAEEWVTVPEPARSLRAR